MRDLKMIVCLKLVPDPEGPSSAFKIDPEGKRVIPVGIPLVINPFDENALEAALIIKDNFGGTVIGISMGQKLAQPVLRKALSVGADELILLEDERFKDLDSYSTAYVLSQAIKKIDEYNLIFTGRQAADWDFSQVGSMVGEILQIPTIGPAQKVTVEDRNVLVETLRRYGRDIVKAPMPALVIVSNEIGDLRLPSLKGIRDAQKKPLTTWNIMDINIDPERLRTKRILKLYAPPPRERKCIVIEGKSPQEKGENLAIRLCQDKVI